MDCPPKKMAIVERWPLWRGGHCREVAVSGVVTVSGEVAIVEWWPLVQRWPSVERWPFWRGDH